MYNFSKTKAAEANKYLNPGVYRLRITEVKQDSFGTKNTPFIGIKFENEEGQSFVEKFQFGSEKSTEVSMSRLQYLHQGYFNKGCDKDFKSLEEVSAYFKKALLGKPMTKTIVVGGNENGSNVYACLPYSEFIYPDDADVELGEYDPSSAEYKKVVKKNSTSSEVAGKAGGLLNSVDDTATIGKGKATKATKVEAEPEKKDEDDMPW